MERSLDHMSSSMSFALDGAETESRSVELPCPSMMDVDVETFGGDVVIRAGRQTDGKALVDAQVRAGHGRNRSDEAVSALNDVKVTADVVRGGDVPTLQVRATTTSKEPWLLRTDFEIQVPEARRVSVRTRTGKVYVFENRGGLEVHTTDGEIRVITPWTITENVTLITRGADIVYRVNVGSCGSFDVDIVNGTVLARVEAGDWRILDSRNDHDTLIAQLGNCTNRLLMRTSDAKVIISVVKEPLSHGSVFISP